MLTRLRGQLSPALVISVIALVAAIGGGAAIALPGKNTVNSGDIKKNGVKSSDIKNNNVTGADVNEATLNIPSAAVPKHVYGFTYFGGPTHSTLPGTTVTGGGGTFTYTFPRNVVDCVPVVSGIFSPEFTAFQSGTAPNNANKVTVNYSGGEPNHNLILLCP